MAVLVILLFALRAHAGTISGNLNTPTAGAVKNATLTFTLSQSAIISGTASIVPSTSACYTSISGDVRGIPDPLIAPVLSPNLASGSLTAGTYYVKITYTGAGGESYPSPESKINLSGTGTIVVSAPTLQPENATGYKVYISSSTGTETLQATITGWSNYSQSVALVAGAALPSSNSSSCSLSFSDQMIPTGTYYQVNLLNRNGIQMAGYPQTWCTYGGAAGNINVSNGAPTGNCGTQGVYYPTPIWSQPTLNALQSISGPLDLSGYALTGVLSLNTEQYVNVYATGGNGTSGSPWTGWDTAITWTSGQVYYFPAGFYQLSTPIALSGNNIALQGGPCGNVAVAAYIGACAYIKAAPNANLAEMVNITAKEIVLRDLVLDGNQANAGVSGPDVSVTDAYAPFIENVVAMNAKTHGLSVFSTGTGALSGSGKISRSMFVSNVQDGIHCQGTPDWFVSQTESENNNGDGIELSDCPTWRIEHSDIGGNGITSGRGLYLHGTTTGLGSGAQIIVGNQFGNNYQEDLYIEGYNGGYTARFNTVAGNSFASSQNRPNATYPDVTVIDGYQNQFTGNFFGVGAASHLATYGISFTETSSGRAFSSTVVGNAFGNGFTGGLYNDNVTNPDVITANSEAETGFSQIGQRPYLANNHWLYGQDSGGTPVALVEVGSDNNSYLNAKTGQVVNFQVNGATKASVSASGLTIGAGAALSSSGVGGTVAATSQLPLVAGLSTTAATSDNVSISGVVSGSHCVLTPTNASAATNIATTYISSKTTNQITVTHTATGGMTYDIVCTPN